HLHGGMVPMREVLEICSAAKIPVIEDAAQAPGAIVQGRPAGTWGDVGVLSFGGSKLLTAGRGGAILTRHADVHQRARLWIHRGNLVCPLSELQAAVLLPQLARLEERNRIRAEAVRALTDAFRDLAELRPFINQSADSKPAYYKLGWQFDASQFGLPRNAFVAAMRAEGIGLDEGFRGLHMGRSPSRFRAVGSLAEASRAHHGTVVLHHPVLLGSHTDLAEVALAFQKVRAHAEQLAVRAVGEEIR
ncbi:MAG TPA: DegT/DnrJ/EryC1/StrS family aminotransferase, partial [Gemmataceae bacterium]|nr:DegT/DnrJ/EryC1/StrS family aminotransferase [Gemmataceae bacterium]